MGIGYNFGHFLMDHMLPAIEALEIYGLLHRIDNAQVVLFRGCKAYDFLFKHVTGSTPLPKVELCKRHYDEWLQKYFFKAPPLLLHKDIGREGVRHFEPDVKILKSQLTLTFRSIKQGNTTKLTKKMTKLIFENVLLWLFVV